MKGRAGYAHAVNSAALDSDSGETCTNTSTTCKVMLVLGNLLTCGAYLARSRQVWGDLLLLKLCCCGCAMKCHHHAGLRRWLHCFLIQVLWASVSWQKNLLHDELPGVMQMPGVLAVSASVAKTSPDTALDNERLRSGCDCAVVKVPSVAGSSKHILQS